jgi:hypothetical protein
MTAGCAESAHPSGQHPRRAAGIDESSREVVMGWKGVVLWTALAVTATASIDEGMVHAARTPARGDAAAALTRRLAATSPASELPSAHVLELALRAYERAALEGKVKHPRLTIIDYSLPSTARRLWVIDVDRARVLFHELVAHGRGTGDDTAESFSNEPGTHKSSLGLFVTAETYGGGHGYSLRLDGLDAGVNDNARLRDIVVHGATYVSPSFAARHGRLGRSWGCPALRPAIAPAVIDAIKDGGAVFAYYPDRGLLRRWAQLR